MDWKVLFEKNPEHNFMPPRGDGEVNMNSVNRRSQRLFFALVADGVQEPLQGVYAHLIKYPHLLKTVSPDNYHVTLKFLGETNSDTYTKLYDDFTRLSPGVRPVRFQLQGLGGFPDVKRARVIWCGLIADTADLRAIHECIESTSEKHGFKKENRAFTPHFTLARTRTDRKIPAEMAQYLADNRNTLYGEAVFDKIVLYRSEPGKNGPLYKELAVMRL